MIPKEKKEALRQEVLIYLEGLKSQPFEDVKIVRQTVIQKVDSFDEIPPLGKQLLIGRLNATQARTPAEYLEKLIAEVRGM